MPFAPSPHTVTLREVSCVSIVYACVVDVVEGGNDMVAVGILSDCGTKARVGNDLDILLIVSF